MKEADTDLRSIVEAALDALIGPFDDDLERVIVADVVLSLAQTWLVQEVEQARRNGATWRELGDVLGVSRQAAHERFRGRKGAYQHLAALQAEELPFSPPS
jgi:hypothetical protein